MADDDDDDVFTTRFNKLFHKASKEREERFKKDLFSQLDTNLDAKLGSKFDEIKMLILNDDDDDERPAPRDREQGAGGGRSGDQFQLPPEIQARIKKTEEESKRALALAEQHKSEAEKERAANRRNEERQLITQTLAPHVKPSLLDMVVNTVHEKHLTRDADEPAKFLWKNEDGETLPFKDGAEYWRKSDQGKEVAPPRDVRGSGSRAGDNSGSKDGTFTAENLADAIMGR